MFDRIRTMEPIVKLQVHGHTATVTLNRPHKRNALSRELLAELQQALSDLRQERKVRAVVIAGAGPVFSAGMDLDEMLSANDQEDRQDQWHADSLAYHELIETMLRFPKPLVAAVDGPAVAGAPDWSWLATWWWRPSAPRSDSPSRAAESWPAWSRRSWRFASARRMRPTCC